jgi:hypothetical protein
MGKGVVGPHCGGRGWRLRRDRRRSPELELEFRIAGFEEVAGEGRDGQGEGIGKGDGRPWFSAGDFAGLFAGGGNRKEGRRGR